MTITLKLTPQSIPSSPRGDKVPADGSGATGGHDGKAQEFSIVYTIELRVDDSSHEPISIRRPDLDKPGVDGVNIDIKNKPVTTGQGGTD